MLRSTCKSSLYAISLGKVLPLFLPSKKNFHIFSYKLHFWNKNKYHSLFVNKLTKMINKFILKIVVNFLCLLQSKDQTWVIVICIPLSHCQWQLVTFESNSYFCQHFIHTWAHVPPVIIFVSHTPHYKKWKSFNLFMFLWTVNN